MWALIIHPHSKSNWSPESWRLGGSEQHAPLYACINWYSTNVFYNACIRRYSVLLMVGAWHIYCCSVHPGREIPPPWLFLRFLWLSSLESKDRRCCTLNTFKQCILDFGLCGWNWNDTYTHVHTVCNANMIQNLELLQFFSVNLTRCVCLLWSCEKAKATAH